MIQYEVRFSEKALKALKRMDKQQAKFILAWIRKNLVNCEKPRQHGKGLTANKKGYWRYRVGDYRLIAEINDGIAQISMIHIGHRRDVYQ